MNLSEGAKKLLCKGILPIKYKKVHPLAKAPSKAHPTDACWDVFSTRDYTILSGETALIDTGLVFDVPVGYCIKVYSRSGLAAKYSLSVLNGPGVVDSGYVGEVSVIIHNHSKDAFYAPTGSKVGQIMLERLLDYEFIEGEVNMDTVRGPNGLGSTGI